MKIGDAGFSRSSTNVYVPIITAWLKLRISQPGSEYQEENDHRKRQFPLPMMNGMILVVPDVFQSITYIYRYLHAPGFSSYAQCWS